MTKPFYAADETNSENTDGCCTVIYSEVPLNEEEVKEAIRYVSKNRRQFRNAPLVGDLDVDNEFGAGFCSQEVPTPVSKKAGLYRYECC